MAVVKHYLPVGKPKKRGGEAPFAQGLMFPAEDLRRQRKLKVVTWCEIGEKLKDFRKYFKLGREGLHWYDNTPKILLELFDGNVARRNLYIYLLAATSPLENIKQNSRLALKALKLFDVFGAENLKVWKKAFAFEAHRLNILRALRGEPLSGPKVTSFAKNLLGPGYFPDAADAVTVDRWMMRVARGLCSEPEDKSEDAPSEPEYRCVERAVRKLAQAEGVEPRQYQAAVWVGIKRTCGDPADIADPFEVELRRLLHSGQSEFDFDAPAPEIEDDPLAGFVFDTGELAGEVLGFNPGAKDELEARILDSGGGEYVVPVITS